MTQRVFDVNNPRDVWDLFNLFDDKYIRIYKMFEHECVLATKNDRTCYVRLIKINWRDKGMLYRPKRGSDAEQRIKTLQAIIDGAGIKGVNVADYDTTLPDSMDERDAGGLWDLAGVLADRLGRESDTNNKGACPQTLLYELMCQFKKTIMEE